MAQSNFQSLRMQEIFFIMYNHRAHGTERIVHKLKSPGFKSDILKVEKVECFGVDIECLNILAGIY